MSIKVMCFVGAKDRIKIFIGEGSKKARLVAIALPGKVPAKSQIAK
jgi:hypothetical protein